MLARAWRGGSSRALAWSRLGPCRHPPAQLGSSRQGMQSMVGAQKTGYVGQNIALASEYHESDFNWEEHAVQVGPLVAAREEEARQLFGSAQHLQPPSIASPERSDAKQPGDAAAESAFEGDSWESFYKLHGAAKFYKLRRYILLEFPQLARAKPAHVMEIGCGCGSSMLPVLMTNPQATATATDVSSTCIMQLRAAAQAMSIDHASRVSSFVCDSTDPREAERFEGLGVDYLLIMFTLSAVTPEQQLEMLRNAFRALRPGGQVLLRDHGLYDMVQLRILPHQWLGVPNLYKRGDGTLSYFFSTQDLSSRAEAAGLVVEEARYICVNNTNRKTGVQLRRVFVHGVFRKPL